MPWQEVSAMSLREDFVVRATVPGANVRALCREFGISAKTGYKWVNRFRAHGYPGLTDRSRRPKQSPSRTPLAMEEAVLRLRTEHPAWGARKLRARLRALGTEGVPSASTITAVLHRHGQIDPTEAAKHRPWQRFEHEAPNDLWQMDFKGPFLAVMGRLHALTVLDDHSRFCVGLEACRDQRGTTVQDRLTAIFRSYGLPERMLMDNGAPWGDDRDHPYTALTVWLLRLGIGLSHGRPYHPQTQGKDERFHRTLIVELLAPHIFVDRAECQAEFDRWRQVYNVERPHDALGLDPPGKRYQPSVRTFPEHLPPLEYDSHEVVRKVQAGGEIAFQGRTFRVGNAFRGYQVALREGADDGLYHVYFGQHCIAKIDPSSGVRT